MTEKLFHTSKFLAVWRKRLHKFTEPSEGFMLLYWLNRNLMEKCSQRQSVVMLTGPDFSTLRQPRTVWPAWRLQSAQSCQSRWITHLQASHMTQVLWLLSNKHNNQSFTSRRACMCVCVLKLWLWTWTHPGFPGSRNEQIISWAQL